MGPAQKAHSAYHNLGLVLGCVVDAKTEKAETFREIRVWNPDSRIEKAQFVDLGVQ
jgi:hypothetical protein